MAGVRSETQQQLVERLKAENAEYVRRYIEDYIL